MSTDLLQPTYLIKPKYLPFAFPYDLVPDGEDPFENYELCSISTVLEPWVSDNFLGETEEGIRIGEYWIWMDRFAPYDDNELAAIDFSMISTQIDYTPEEGFALKVFLCAGLEYPQRKLDPDRDAETIRLAEAALHHRFVVTNL
jgi:hypothetical protein